MSAGAAPRVGRYYTSARRHPWVLGKLADWKLPLGPYTPAQITVAVAGGLLLIKTVSWWTWMGPIPLVAWAAAIWIVRRPRIGGRAPMLAAAGLLTLVWQPAGGRIGGRPARDRQPRRFHSAFVIEEFTAPNPGGSHGPPRTPRKRTPRTDGTSQVPVSSVQLLLARTEEGSRS
ncbi:hypothetical protein ACFQ7N_09970 [Streptomyces niveus]|uniref:hypothetical protein n=1 Tax=Streptomyces niveus TaxID=193462 RepID=UPI0036C9D335